MLSIHGWVSWITPLILWWSARIMILVMLPSSWRLLLSGVVMLSKSVACRVYPLAVGFNFESVPLGITPMLKVETPLPQFVVGTIAAEHTDHFWAEVETETDRVLGSFGPRIYDALMAVNIPNDGDIYRVFEQMGVSYFPRP
jgi:hypothetical protein